MTGINMKPNPCHIVGDIKKINYSSDDFKKIRELNTCYVDKSKLIEDILNYDDGKIMLFTRPRRFGKSLNLSMMRYFFDMKQDSRALFHDLYIENSDLFEANLNQYPVVYLNLKDANVGQIEDAKVTILSAVERSVRELIEKYGYEELKQLNLKLPSGGVWTEKVREITEILKRRTGKEVIVLVDEYDNLINKAYGTKDWISICNIIKDIFGALFKSNENLKFGILTGVSRIGKELSFSDMNNLAVYGMTNSFYYEYFGFTEEEVKTLLSFHHIPLTEDFYQMYNGYRLNDSQNMFNTASILKFLDNYIKTNEILLDSYWVNAATNRILKDNIAKMDFNFKEKLLSLIDGASQDEGLTNSIDYEELDKEENLFTLLIDAGYLCPVKKIAADTYKIKVPNKEVLMGYKDMIDLIVGSSGQTLKRICESVIQGKIEKFENHLNQVLLEVSSFHDFSEKENSYHCLLMGAFLYLLDTWNVKPNRESGHGRYDIALIPKEVYRGKYAPIIIEFKVAAEKMKEKEYSQEELESLAKEAIDQIEKRRYDADFNDLYEPEDFVLIGIGAQGKNAKAVWKGAVDQ